MGGCWTDVSEIQQALAEAIDRGEGDLNSITYCYSDNVDQQRDGKDGAASAGQTECRTDEDSGGHREHRRKPCGSALRTFGHLTAIGFEFLRKIFRATSALSISRHRVVDEFRVGQLQPLHQRDVVRAAAPATESRVPCLLLCNAGNTASIVVVARIDERLTRK